MLVFIASGLGSVFVRTAALLAAKQLKFESQVRSAVNSLIHSHASLSKILNTGGLGSASVKRAVAAPAI